MFSSAFLLLLLLLLLLLVLLLLSQTRRSENFPPGPPALPVFGNLLDLDLESPLSDLEKLARRYGNVYSLFVGSRPAVVLNGLRALKEALVDKAADFSGRPQGMLVHHAVVVKAAAPGLVLADYNWFWKQQRRFGLTTLRNFGLGKLSMEQRILGELHHVIRILDQSVGETLNPERLFHSAASNVVCQVLFSRRFDYDDDFMTFSVGFFQETSKILNGRWGMIYDSVPMVRNLPLPFQKAFRLFKEAHERRVQMLSECKKSRVANKPRHFIDCYLDELEKTENDGSSSFSEDQLCAFLLDLHFAGTDTTANTLLTAFLYLMNYPRVQERCQQEIDKVLDGKEVVSYEDRHQMPYVQAVIHEIQRKADTVPLSVYHCTTRDTELMGYSIPRGTIVIPNLSSVLSEENQWKHPHDFDPENFLNDDGEFVKPEAFLPFSTGPRVCLGEALARMELFLIVVTLLRRFNFIWPQDAGDADFRPVFGTTQTPKPYHMKVEVRTRG